MLLCNGPTVTYEEGDYAMINVMNKDVLSCDEANNYKFDGIDAITLEIDVYGIIDYEFDGIDPITLEIELI